MAAVGFRHGHSWHTVKELMARPGMEMVGLYEDHPALLERALAQWPTKVFNDPVELLEEARPEIVALCPTNVRKGPLIVECLRRGISVFADKPMFIDMNVLEEAERVRLSAKRRPALMCSMGLRGSPLYATAMRIVQDGVVGRVASVYTRRPHKLNPAGRQPWELDMRQNGGVLIDLGVHDVDMVLHSLGEKPMRVIARHSNLRFTELEHFIDNGSMCFHFPSGATATVEPNWLNPDASAFHGDCCVLFMGTKGFLTLDETRGGLFLTTLSEKEHQVELLTRVPDLVEDFLRQHRGERYEVEPAEIVEAHRWVIRAAESARQGGKSVES